jgi:hypothetical protein
MPGNTLVDANCEIILRDANLEDAGEVTRFIQWTSLLKLNDVSSWQLDVQTQNFRDYGIDETMGIMFRRDGELILDGPIMQIKQSLVSGQEKTSIIGGCDLALLKPRICYPVVSGPIWDTKAAGAGAWRFAVMRSAVGISAVTIKDSEFDTSTTDTSHPAVLYVATAIGFVDGNTCNVINTNGAIHPRTIVGVDLSGNTITVSDGDSTPWPTGTMIYQTSGGIVDDPAFVGYDTRTGPAENVAKELAYFNAGAGACVDQFGPRAIPFLVVAPSTGRGDIVTANSRGESLLTQIQNVCISGGMNFSLTQQDQSLVFDVFYGNDLSVNEKLVFSVDGGNLKDYDYSYGPPVANFVMGAGPDTGTSKLMLPSGDQTSINQYGRRETWISSGSSKAGDNAATIAANMVAANNLELAQSLLNSSLTLSIQENDQVRYPRDFRLGDRVGVMVGDMLTSAVISYIRYDIPVGTGGAQGSAIEAALTKTMTKQMRIQDDQSKLLRQITMT